LRTAYTRQQTELTRAISTIKEFQQQQTGMMTLLKRLDAAAKAAEAQKAVVQELDRRAAAPEEQIAQSDAHIIEIGDGLSQNLQDTGRKPQNDSTMMRKEVLNQDPGLRFTVLKDWLEKNSLAILRRAAHEWKTAEDLIIIIPSALEPVAELLDGRVLMVGTRGYPEKHAITISDHDPSSGLIPAPDILSPAGGKP
jgi:hypothetical protein